MTRSPSEESTTTTECGVVDSINYFSNATEVAQKGALSCSRPQPASDIGVRDGTSNWLAVTLPPTLHRAAPSELHVLHDVNAGPKSQDLLQPQGGEPSTIGMAAQRTWLCGHSRYKDGPHWLSAEGYDRIRPIMFHDAKSILTHTCESL